MAGWDPTVGSGEKDDAGGRDVPAGIVWLEKGEERAFEPLPELRRPWLEESSAWGAAPGNKPEAGGPSGDSPEPPELIWL